MWCIVIQTGWLLGSLIPILVLCFSRDAHPEPVNSVLNMPILALTAQTLVITGEGCLKSFSPTDLTTTSG